MRVRTCVQEWREAQHVEEGENQVHVAARLLTGERSKACDDGVDLLVMTGHGVKSAARRIAGDHVGGTVFPGLELWDVGSALRRGVSKKVKTKCTEAEKQPVHTPGIASGHREA